MIENHLFKKINMISLNFRHKILLMLLIGIKALRNIFIILKCLYAS